METKEIDKTLGNHSARIVNLESRSDKVDIILDKVRNRLPIWASVIGAVMLGIIGYLIK